MERGIVAKVSIHIVAPNVVTLSAVKENAPRKGTYIKAGTNNKTYVRPNRIPKNLETFLISFVPFLTWLVSTMLIPTDNFFENVLIDGVNECMFKSS